MWYNNSLCSFLVALGAGSHLPTGDESLQENADHTGDGSPQENQVL